MSIIDRKFLLQQLPKATIQRIASPITVKGVGQGNHRCNEYVRLDIHLQRIPIALIQRDVHVVEGMKAKILIGMDIIGPEKITLDIPRQIAVVSSCRGAKIPIAVIPRSEQRIARSIKSSDDITIPPYAHATIPIQQQHLPDDRDLLFEPVAYTNGIAVYTHIIDCHLAAIQAQNDSESPIILRRDTLLGTISGYEVDGYFLAYSDVAFMVASSDIPDERQQIRNVIAAATATTIEEAVNGPTKTSESHMDNGVTIYGDDTSDFEGIVNIFPDLWTDNGAVVDICKDQWMEIPLVENWRELYNPR